MPTPADAPVPAAAAARPAAAAAQRGAARATQRGAARGRGRGRGAAVPGAAPGAAPGVAPPTPRERFHHGSGGAYLAGPASLIGVRLYQPDEETDHTVPVAAAGHDPCFLVRGVFEEVARAVAGEADSSFYYTGWVGEDEFFAAALGDEPDSARPDGELPERADFDLCVASLQRLKETFSKSIDARVEGMRQRFEACSARLTLALALTLTLTLTLALILKLEAHS